MAGRRAVAEFRQVLQHLAIADSRFEAGSPDERLVPNEVVELLATSRLSRIRWATIRSVTGRMPLMAALQVVGQLHTSAIEATVMRLPTYPGARPSSAPTPETWRLVWKRLGDIAVTMFARGGATAGHDGIIGVRLGQVMTVTDDARMRDLVVNWRPPTPEVVARVAKRAKAAKTDPAGKGEQGGKGGKGGRGSANKPNGQKQLDADGHELCLQHLHGKCGRPEAACKYSHKPQA